ncbi:MAG: hypothetical protein IJW86_09655 [Clostridia bacterium]|nr:hypothetical protein [Clostridia bacterium]
MPELSTGWLSPNGDFYPCGVYEHIGTARKILKDETANRADEKLHDCGFVSITISQLGVKQWRIRWKNFLTEQQKNFLKPYFEDSSLSVDGFSNVRWSKENDYDN